MTRLIEVKPRLKEYIPYNLHLLGLPIRGYSDTATFEGHLATIWRGMMRRCYDVHKHNFLLYGGSGVSVCKRWHSLVAFIEDAQKLPQFSLKVEDWTYQLDKDYYSSNQYGPDTCVWLSPAHNGAYTGIAVVAIDPFGRKETYVCQHDAATAIGMPHNSVITRSIVSGERIQSGKYAGYSFIRDDRALRYPLEVL